MMCKEKTTLNSQSILATEMLNLGADPETILNALANSRRDAVGWLNHQEERFEDIIDIVDIIKSLSLVINEIARAIGKEVIDAAA